MLRGSSTRVADKPILFTTGGCLDDERGDGLTMGHRMFTDASGNTWNVWAVIPQWADRRTGKARRARDEDDPDFDPPAIEQRRTPDRRRGLPDQFPRIRLKGGLVGGWLAFECARERRRLSPIPPGWESATDAELERLMKSAASAAPPRRLIE